MLSASDALYVIQVINCHTKGNELPNLNRSFVMMNTDTPYPGRIEKSLLNAQNVIEGEDFS